MSDGQLLDEVRTLFLAGHETTALALTLRRSTSWRRTPTRRPGCTRELDAVLGGRPPALRRPAAAARTRGDVVTESMRLYPPADVARPRGGGRLRGRRRTRSGRGTSVFMSQWVMHRDPRFFADPDAFRPQRWTDAFERSLPRFAYFPFGGGPRVCIGQTFAMTEATLLLATLCQRFAFAPDPTFRLELWPSITLRPLNGVRVRVSERVGTSR